MRTGGETSTPSSQQMTDAGVELGFLPMDLEETVPRPSIFELHEESLVA